MSAKKEVTMKKHNIFFYLFMAFSILWAVIPAILAMCLTDSFLIAFLVYVGIVWKTYTID